jgi:uncharacterized protein
VKKLINLIMKRITDWIKHHQVLAFFLITFMISWGLGYTWVLVVNKSMFLFAPMTAITMVGPALAGIIISRIINTQPKQGTKRAYWIAFLLAWVVSALVFLGNNTFINHAPLSPIMVGFTLISVVPVALVISMARSRIPAVKSYLSSLVRLRGVLRWSLLAIVVFPAFVLISIVVHSLLYRQPIEVHPVSDMGLVLIGLIVVKFLYQFFFFNATGEETGWRGFALPRLQSFTSPLVACLLLNLFWGPWHFFLWMAEGRSIFSFEFWIQTFIELFSGTVTLCWFYNRSRGSILVAGIAHSAANTTLWLFPNLDWTIYNWTVAAAALVIIMIDRMWKKLPDNHPAIYRLPDSFEPGDESVFASTKLSQV